MKLTEKKIQSLEKRFAIKLPSPYRELLKSPPSYLVALLEQDVKDDGCKSQITPYLDAKMIEGTNLMARDPDDPDFEFDPNDSERPWPQRYFIIGSDVGGNFFCITPDSGNDRVYLWEQGCTHFTKYSDDMKGFVKRLFRLYGELALMDMD